MRYFPFSQTKKSLKLRNRFYFFLFWAGLSRWLDNVRVVRVPLIDQLRGTFLWDHWYLAGHWNRSRTPHVHLSDAVRLALVRSSDHCCCCCCCCCFGRSDRSADRFVGPRSNWDEVLVGAELFDGWSCRPTKKLIFPSTDLPFSLHTSHLAMTG